MLCTDHHSCRNRLQQCKSTWTSIQVKAQKMCHKTPRLVSSIWDITLCDPCRRDLKVNSQCRWLGLKRKKLHIIVGLPFSSTCPSGSSITADKMMHSECRYLQNHTSAAVRMFPTRVKRCGCRKKYLFHESCSWFSTCLLTGKKTFLIWCKDLAG